MDPEGEGAIKVEKLGEKIIKGQRQFFLVLYSKNLLSILKREHCLLVIKFIYFLILFFLLHWIHYIIMLINYIKNKDYNVQ